MSVNKIGIIGAGKMGTDIFYYILDYGYSITWLCKNNYTKEIVYDKFNKELYKMEKRSIITKQKLEKINNNVKITANPYDMNSCDLIIEAINEDLKLKKNLFMMLDKIVKKECIFLTNTSSINLHNIFSDVTRKTKCGGLHFFYPIKYKNIIEINITNKIEKDILNKLINFAKNINKRYIILSETNNFLLNKLLMNIQAEACKIHDQGIMNYNDIDQLIKEKLFPVGIFELIDLVGVNIALTCLKNYIENEINKSYYLSCLNKMESLIKKGELGIKAGKGFYVYDNKKLIKNSKYFNLDHIKNKKNKKYVEDVLKRLTYIYLNTFFSYLPSKEFNENDLNYAVKEFLGIEKGPLGLAKEIGYQNIKKSLIKYYKETNEKAYLPANYFNI